MVGDLAGAYSRRINIQHRLVGCPLANSPSPSTLLQLN
nr:hypothetical protein [Methylomonas paludis]